MMNKYNKDKRVLIPRDEFEEEAGEGLGRLSRDEAEADLRELRARMESRLRRPGAIWLPAAAAVVILLVGSALVVTLLRDRPESESDLALAEAAVTDTAYIAMAGPIEREENAASADVRSGVAASKGKKAAYGPLLSVVNNEVAEAFAADEEVVAEAIEVQEEQDDVVFAVVQEEMAEDVIVQAVPQMTMAAMKAKAETADRADDVQGAVVPDRQASPAGGWSDYREYVSRNIRYPEGVTPVLRQEVMVTFTIRTDSTIADLKALRSPGDAFTSEAFRLLREGPRWLPARVGGNTTATEVSVMFVFR
ncbi:MAG TPA: hypothetical protein PLB07_03710 [Bacteroidales bacterium]|nr:hypothetical protein [Bacteroidales bacterium]